MAIFSTEKNKPTPFVKWNNYPFQVRPINRGLDLLEEFRDTNCVFILARRDKTKDKWISMYIDMLSVVQPLVNFEKDLLRAKEEGATHIHIANNLDHAGMHQLHDELIDKYKPQLNIENIKGEQMSDEEPVSNELEETKAKLDLLYKYESHYLELIKEYKEEIKFANALQEDLRRERAQFFTQTLKEVIQTMRSADIEVDVSANWIKDLVDSYTKSIDLSGDLAKTHVIEIFSLLKNETKAQASKTNLDKIDKL